MNPQLLEYYNRELAYLRELGAEFAAAFPKVAGRLSLRELEVADPYVERLLEGFSFLTARIQMKMDAEFPRLSQRILEMVCPHYLAPTPAMVVVEMEPGTSEGHTASGYTLPVGSVLRSRQIHEEQTPCDFRTGHELTLWPIQLNQATLGGPALDLPSATSSLGFDATGHLRIVLKTMGSIAFKDLPLDKLEVYISGTDDVSSHLQELIHDSLLGIVVHDAGNPNRVWAQLSPEALRPEGYDQSQALLPYSHRAFQGHRLLHEYFAFPARFRFFSISGLLQAMQQVEDDCVAITLLFKKSLPKFEAVVSHRNFLLHCVPAINLFERNTDRIHLSPEFNEYHIVVDRTRPRDFEVYSVLSVTGHTEGQIHDRSFVPLYNSVHGIRPEEQAYFATRREPRLFSERAVRLGPRTQYQGSELFLSLVDQRSAPFAHDLKQLSVRTLCTNRDLPLLMATNHSDGDMECVDSVPVSMIRIVAGPSRPTVSVAENEMTWRLISHLSLNYLGMTDLSDEEGAATLRELLGLYLKQGDQNLQGQISGIKSIGISPITRRLKEHSHLVYGRGVGVKATVDEASFAGVSPWPLMSVVEVFLSRHVGMNSFVELSTHSRQRGKVAQWPARTGQRPHV
jgi:type VI secretion system protein ImpG